MKLKTAILTCAGLLLFSIFVNVLVAQAPMNNANTYIMNVGVNPVTDSVSTVGEVISSASPTLTLTARVQFMQELALAAKGSSSVAADPILAAILTKWGVKVNDSTGNQIFP